MKIGKTLSGPNKKKTKADFINHKQFSSQCSIPQSYWNHNTVLCQWSQQIYIYNNIPMPTTQVVHVRLRNSFQDDSMHPHHLISEVNVLYEKAKMTCSKLHRSRLLWDLVPLGYFDHFENNNWCCKEWKRTIPWFYSSKTKIWYLNEYNYSYNNKGTHFLENSKWNTHSNTGHLFPQLYLNFLSYMHIRLLLAVLCI